MHFHRSSCHGSVVDDFTSKIKNTKVSFCIKTDKKLKNVITKLQKMFHLWFDGGK